MLGLMWSVLFLQLSSFAGSMEMDVLEEEVGRAMGEIDLDGSGPPWYIAVDLVDESSVVVRSELGSLLDEDLTLPDKPLRYLRTEVRQGSPEFDSGDMESSSSISFRRLPTELGQWNLARAVWLQLDLAYKSAVSALIRKTTRLDALDTDRPAMAPIEPVQSEGCPDMELDPDWVRATTLTLSATLRDRASVEEVYSIGSQRSTRVRTFTTEGTSLCRIYPEIVFRVQVRMRADDHSLVSNSRSWVVRHRDQLPDQASMLQEVEDMVTALEGTVNAPLLEDYIGPVLLSEPAAVEFFRQLLLPEMLGTPPAISLDYSGDHSPLQAPPAARVGRRLLPFGWTVRDDARVDAPGHYEWDYGGVSPTAVDVVLNGVLRQPLMSRVPLDSDSRSTGHGRSQGSRRRSAFPGVVFVVPPKGLSRRKLEKKALKAARGADLDKVLVIERLEPLALARRIRVHFSGDEAPSGLSQPSQAYFLYSNGVREPVRLGRFLGVDRRSMRDILAAGRPGPVRGVMDMPPSSMRYSMGLTGGLQVGWSVPELVISEMELIGQGGGEARLLPMPPSSLEQ